MSDKNVIDIDSALEQLGDLDFYLELVDELIADIPNKKQTINLALTSGTANDLRLVSHSVKGVSANLHLPGIKNAAMLLEEAAKADSSQEYESLAIKLFIEFDKLLQERTNLIQ